MVDRSFNFKKFDLYNGFEDITLIYSVLLDTTLINISCVDLYEIPQMNNLLILFC